MADEYDTGAFIIFVIALLSIYILSASVFLYKRIRRATNKQPVKKQKSKQLVETEEEVIENPLTTAFWVNLVLVILATIVVCRLSVMTAEEEPELFDPYQTLGIQIGASDRAIKSAYRKMAKIYHPDKPTGSVEKFRDVEKAYRILTDEIAKSNYELYGNPDGPVATKVGIALPEWMLKKGGSGIVVVFYLLLMVVGIPALVYCLKKCSQPKEKAKIKDETVGTYFHAMNESTPLQSVPEIFSTAEELTELMKPQPYDDDLITYLNIMCPKNSFANSKMRKPRISVEKAREDPKMAAWLKTNILIHAYLNHLPVSPAHQRDQQLILAKAPELLQCMTQLAMMSRIRGKPASLSLVTTVMHFQQCMYQGQWINDSPLKQLPFFNEREANANRSRNRENELKDLLAQDPSKWKGLQHLLKDQLDEAIRVAKHLPQLEVEVRWEVEDEEDIFPGDPVTCVVKIVQKQMLPEGVTVEQAMKGDLPDIDSDSEEEEEVKEDEKNGEDEVKMALTVEEMEEMAKPEKLKLEPGVVYSKHFPYRIHDHWLVILTDREDKSVYDANLITPMNMVSEIRLFMVRAPKDGLHFFHLHFFHGAYQGLDFVTSTKMRVKPESLKPKIEVNQKDLDLDKQRGLMDMLNMEMDDGWASSDDEEEEEVKEKKEKKEEGEMKEEEEMEEEEEEGDEEEEEEMKRKKEEMKHLSSQERKRLYHKKRKEAEKAAKAAAKAEKEAEEAAKAEKVEKEEEVKETPVDE